MVLERKDREGKMTKIEGPLGIWPFPVLNTLIEISGDSSEEAKIVEVNRDDNGQIQSIETFRR